MSTLTLTALLPVFLVGVKGLEVTCDPFSVEPVTEKVLRLDDIEEYWVGWSGIPYVPLAHTLTWLSNSHSILHEAVIREYMLPKFRSITLIAFRYRRVIPIHQLFGKESSQMTYTGIFEYANCARGLLYQLSLDGNGVYELPENDQEKNRNVFQKLIEKVTTGNEVVREYPMSVFKTSKVAEVQYVFRKASPKSV